MDPLLSFSEELVASFKRYFAVVKQRDDKPTIENPFYFLAGDKFWQVTPHGGNEPLYREGHSSGAPSVAALRRQGAVGRFDEGQWALMGDPVARHQLCEALIARYFPEKREELAALVVGTRGATTTSCSGPPGRRRRMRSARWRRMWLSLGTIHSDLPRTKDFSQVRA